MGLMSEIIFNKNNSDQRRSRRAPFILTFVVIITLSFIAKYTYATSFNSEIVDAADIGDLSQVIKLLKEGTSPDDKGDFGVTALMRAAFRGNTDIIQALVEAGAYVNAADIGGATALHLAAKNGHTDAVRALLYYGAYIDVPDKENWTPLMRATLGKHVDTAQILIDKGADIAALNSINESVLVHAAIAGVPEIISLITGSKQADKITKDQENMAMELAKRKRHKGVEKVLTAFMKEQNDSDNMFAKNEEVKQTPLETNTDQLVAAIAGKNTISQITPQSIKQAPEITEQQKPYEFANNISKQEKYESKPQESYSTEPDSFTSNIRPETKKPLFPSPNQDLSANNGKTYVSENLTENKHNFSKYAQTDAEQEQKKPTDIKIEKPIELNKKIKQEQPKEIASTIKDIKQEQQTTPELPVMPMSHVNYDSGGKFFVQLGNFTSEEDAKDAWEKISPRNTDVLFQLSPVIIKAPLEAGSNVFRLRAGTIHNRQEANATCKAIRGRDSECFVVEVSDTPDALYAKAPLAPQEQPWRKDNHTTQTAQTKEEMPRASLPTTPKQMAQNLSGNYPRLSSNKEASTQNQIAKNDYAEALPSSIPSQFNTSVGPVASVAENILIPQNKPIDITQDYIPSNDVLPWHTEEYKQEQEKQMAMLENKPDTIESQPQYNQPISQPAYNQYANQYQRPEPYQQAPAPEQNQYADNNYPTNTYNKYPYTPKQTPQETNNFERNKEKIRAEVQEITRKDFFKNQGIQPPERKKQEYEDFYKQVAKDKNAPHVSEAILVPDETYFTNNISPASNYNTTLQTGGTWLEIANLPGKAFAEDYAARMFRADESLRNVNIRITQISENSATMNVGPVPPEQAGSLCGIVAAGGFSCNISGSTSSPQNSGYTNSFNTPQEPSHEYWINLGTFANESEAEYYWMFLKEDNGDLISPLQYSLLTLDNYNEFGYGAVQLRTGPFSIKQRASQICSIMRYRNIACILAN